MKNLLSILVVQQPCQLVERGLTCMERREEFSCQCVSCQARSLTAGLDFDGSESGTVCSTRESEPRGVFVDSTPRPPRWQNVDAAMDADMAFRVMMPFVRVLTPAQGAIC